ncbi:MAG: ATP-binding protein [Candidatus Thermoplasmatota archaeon]
MSTIETALDSSRRETRELDEALDKPPEYDAFILTMVNEIAALNREIGATNDGLIAVHKELEDRARELETARRQLAASEKFAALGSLVAGVAHEVRTPLTIIATNLYVLERFASKAAQSGEYAPLVEQVPAITREVLAAIERVQGLVKSLSRFSQAQSVVIESLLDPIVREAVDLYAAVNRSRTPVVADLRSTQPVLVDKAKVQQVVLNLIENAVQASTHASRSVVIRTRDDVDGAGAVLEVEDQGIGMTRETKARMFEPLFTTKVDGTGIGLAIVQHIAREHHATIFCESEPGVGTIVALHFPARAPAA